MLRTLIIGWRYSNTAMSKCVKLALVGCGRVTSYYIESYKDLAGRGCREFEITACCDIRKENAEKAAEEIARIQASRPEVYTDIDELVRSTAAEAAVVCAPNCYHHTIAVALMAGGLHVMVEKPLGITVKAAKTIIEAAEKYKRVLATAETTRRYLSARSCAWAINKKCLIGDIRMVNIHRIGRALRKYELPAEKWHGLKLLSGGGTLMDEGAHLGDMLQVLFGEIDEVACTMDRYDNRMIADAPVVGNAQVDIENAWHAVTRFKSGLHVLSTFSAAFYGGPFSIGHYYGSTGTITDLGYPLNPFLGGGEAVLADGTKVSSEQMQSEYMASLTDEEKARVFPYGVTDGFAVELWDFADAVLTGRKPEIDGHDGLRAMTFCECCFESATTGKPVKFKHVLEGKISEYQKPIDDFWKL